MIWVPDLDEVAMLQGVNLRKRMSISRSIASNCARYDCLVQRLNKARAEVWFGEAFRRIKSHDPRFLRSVQRPY